MLAELLGEELVAEGFCVEFPIAFGNSSKNSASNFILKSNTSVFCPV